MSFKVGDRVVVNGKQDGKVFNNNKGFVVSVIDMCGYEIGVQIDATSEHLHSCGGNGEDGKCWWFDKDKVKHYINKWSNSMKYKAGDKVRVNNTAKYAYGGCTQIDGLVGQVCEVKDVLDSNYKVYTPDKSDYWYYKEEWLDPVETHTEDETVTFTRSNDWCDFNIRLTNSNVNCKKYDGTVFKLVPEKDEPPKDKPRTHTYQFKGKVNYELLCREAFNDGLYAFVLIEGNYTSIFVSDFVNTNNYEINLHGKNYPLSNLTGVNRYSYCEIPMLKERTSKLIAIAKQINQQEHINTMKLKRDVRVGNDKSISSKVVYWK